MGSNQSDLGLYRKGNIWYVRKVIIVGSRRERIQESTRTSDRSIAAARARVILREAEDRLIHGTGPVHTMGEAMAEVLKLRGRNTREDMKHFDLLESYIADVPVGQMHRDHPKLVQFVQDRQAAGRSNNTINRSLEKVSLLLNLSTRWRDGDVPWLKVAPKIGKLPRVDKHRPAGSEAPGYPLTQGQARALFKQLALRSVLLHDICLYLLHTGCRAGEAVNLRWEWEREVPALKTSVFDIPATVTKTGRARTVVLNSIATDVVKRRRGIDEHYVFALDGRPLSAINNTSWCAARKAAGLDDLRAPGKHFRVHDLRTTCATWLRECGVGLEDRRAILGHSSKDMTTHYSSAELGRLLEAVEHLANVDERPSLYVVRGGKDESGNA